MAKIRKIKDKKIKKVAETGFKEVKSNNKDILEEESEKTDNLENQEESFPGFSGARRAAPVLEASEAEQSQQLEDTVRDAPSARNNNANTGTNPLYTGTIPESNYGNSNYTAGDYEEPQKKISVGDLMRPAGLLDEHLSIPEAPRTMPIQHSGGEWQGQKQGKQIMPEKREYETIDDSFKKKLPFERKRRM
jgi:hypothetical protein